MWNTRRVGSGAAARMVPASAPFTAAASAHGARSGNPPRLYRHASTSIGPRAHASTPTRTLIEPPDSHTVASLISSRSNVPKK